MLDIPGESWRKVLPKWTVKNEMVHPEIMVALREKTFPFFGKIWAETLAQFENSDGAVEGPVGRMLDVYLRRALLEGTMRGISETSEEDAREGNIVIRAEMWPVLDFLRYDSEFQSDGGRRKFDPLWYEWLFINLFAFVPNDPDDPDKRYRDHLLRLAGVFVEKKLCWPSLDNEKGGEVARTQIFGIAAEEAALLSYRELQGKVYSVSPSLAKAFSETHIKGVPCGLLRLPRKCIYVDLGACRGVTKGWAEGVEVSGLYVVESGEITHYPNVEDGESVLGIEWTIIVIGRIGAGSDVAIGWFLLKMEDGESIDQAAKESIQSLSHVIDGCESVHFPLAPTIEEQLQVFEKVLRVLIGVVYYVTHSQADVVLADASPSYQRLRARMLKAKGKKRKKLSEKLRGAKPLQRIVLGGQYTIDRKRDPEIEEGIGIGKKLACRFWVSGHYRNQPHGKGRKERRLIWIEPFMKGEDFAPLQESKAQVK